MQLGASLRSAYLVGDHRLGARWMVERARAAYDAGFDALFVGDHHSVGVPYYQNTPMLGRLLAEWHGRPAGCLFLLPLWNPVLAAEQIGTLAALHDDRFVLQCAIGGGDEQFRALGATLRTRPSVFEAGLDVIRRLLAGERVTATVGSLHIEGAQIAPRPAEPVEVWIGAAADPAVARAARLGDGFIVGPEAPPDEVARLVERYCAECAALGKPAGPIALRRDVHVAPTDAEADAQAGPVIAAGYRGFPPGATVCGSPGRVAEAFAAFGELGIRDVIVRHLAEDQGAVLRSFELLGEVRRAIAGEARP